MAYMVDKKPENNSGEKYFWEQCNQLLPDEDVVVYNNHEVNGTEFDFCLFIKNKGIAIVEVKAWEPDDITVNSKDDIYVKSFNKSFKSPKSQANVYRYALKNKIESKYHFTPLVLSMVCYTKISKRQYYELRLDIASEIEYTLVKEDLDNENLLYGKICAIFDKDAYYPHDSFTENRMLKIREMWESKISSTSKVENKHYSTLTVFTENVSKDDLDVLEKEYNSGIKQVVFVRKEEDEQAICRMLNDTLKSRNINARKGNLEIGFKDEVHIPINIFGFQVFVYKCDLSVNNKVEIIDGHIEGLYFSIRRIIKKYFV